jgi:uncharacterized membrane protein YphA (DoxX/SURF4 family)
MMRDSAFAVGRAGLASLFILGAINKIATWDTVATRMEEVGLSPAWLLLPATVALEGIGGLMVALGVRGHHIAAGALAVFTLATNWYFHRFWELEGQIAGLELSLFFKNIAIAGALVAIAALGWKPANPSQG